MENIGFMKIPNVFSPYSEPPLLIMNIDIGRGSCEELIIRRNEDYEEVARNFCEKFDLNQNLAGILIENIKINIKSKTDMSFTHDFSEFNMLEKENSQKNRNLTEIYQDQKKIHTNNIFFQNKLQKSPKNEKNQKKSPNAGSFKFFFSFYTKNHKIY